MRANRREFTSTPPLRPEDPSQARMFFRNYQYQTTQNRGCWTANLQDGQPASKWCFEVWDLKGLTCSHGPLAYPIQTNSSAVTVPIPSLTVYFLLELRPKSGTQVTQRMFPCHDHMSCCRVHTLGIETGCYTLRLPEPQVESSLPSCCYGFSVQKVAGRR